MALLVVDPAKIRRCIYVLDGHTSTIRCIRVLHNRPLAVTGSRDTTIRVWNIQKGTLLRVLQGHQQSVRCLDVCGNRVVSGSYDATCRVSNPTCFRYMMESLVSRRYGTWIRANACTSFAATAFRYIR